MQQTNKSLHTPIASYDCYEAMAVSRDRLVYILLRKKLIQLYSMYLG